MRLSLIQITVGPQIEKNFEKVEKFINQALSFKPNLILLPECFLFLSNIKKFSFSMDHEYILHYQNFAKKNKISTLRTLKLNNVLEIKNDKSKFESSGR